MPSVTTGHVMQEASTHATTDQLLSELANTLREERDALVHLDAEGIERSAADKARLSDALGQCRAGFTPVHTARLSALQTELRHNLILLVHARDHVHNTLGILTGRSNLPAQIHKHSTESVRLDLRG